MQNSAHTDSHARTRGTGSLVRAGVLIASVLAIEGCADPCVDDGVGQEKPEVCPQLATESESATESASMTTSFTATDSETMTTSATTSMTASSMTSVDATDTASATQGDQCPIYDDHLTPKTATMVLLIDQSGSMDQPFDMGTRWTTLRETLLDPMNGVVAQYENDIRFGMTLYTNDAMTMGCPDLIAVPPVLGNYQNITDTFDMNLPLGDTPTGESVTAATTAFEADPGEGQRIIVLATDGEPDLCSDPDGDGRQVSVDAVTAAFAVGIRTVVISVGEDIAAAHLQDLANAGAGVAPGDPDEPYYLALDQAMLAMAFDTIIQGVRMCELDLDEPLAADASDTCVIEINGNPVAFGDPDGWQINDPTHVELLGGACDAIQFGNVEVLMTCGC